MWNRLLDRMIRSLMKEGTAIIHMPDGSVNRYGDGTGTPVTIRLTDPALPRKILSSFDLAIGEAYMDGRLTIDDDDLYGFLTLGIRNAAIAHRQYSLMDRFRRLLRRVETFNPIGRA